MDGFGEIGVFVRVVEARSFTRAGKLLGLTASGVSRIITRLEARLGVRLLERTTRSTGLTSDGAAYYETCTRILRELEDANIALARVRGAPRGRLRVDAPTVLGRYVLGPALPKFLQASPELAVDLSVHDHLIDPIAEGVDVVVRMAELRESALVHKKVGAMNAIVVAAPAYLARRGRPKHPRDLRQHDTIGFMTGSAAFPWRFRLEGREERLSFTGRFRSNNADAIRSALVAGLGISYVLEFHVREELARGTLEVLLPEYQEAPRAIYALYTREKSALPKVRVFLEFLVECLRECGAAPGR